ncbi:MAG: PACE efflux transporter [Rhodocyclaceae bacterium]|nr:PACE efflux transporter [Rhodocyclaceae bacterium]
MRRAAWGHPSAAWPTSSRANHRPDPAPAFSRPAIGFPAAVGYVAARLPVPPVKSPPQRRLVDRLRQIALFELGGLLLITPPFMWLSGVGLEHSLGLLASAALVAALWNAAYNIGFDRVEGHLTGRTADRRPWRLRVIHAIGFELGLLLLTLPLVMAWTGLGWLAALLADLALAAAYVVYAFAFNLAYDRAFPICAAPATGPAPPD